MTTRDRLPLDDPLDDWVDALYAELRRLARRYRSSPDATLDTTALVHEAYLKLSRSERTRGWKDRQHFLAVSARAMRQIVIDHAREATRQKRGGDRHRVTLEGSDAAVDRDAAEILAVDQALEKLEEERPRWVRVVECRYFAGFSEPETAETLDLSVATVQRDWQGAKSWLERALAGPAG